MTDDGRPNGAAKGRAKRAAAIFARRTSAAGYVQNCIY